MQRLAHITIPRGSALTDRPPFPSRLVALLLVATQAFPASLFAIETPRTPDKPPAPTVNRRQPAIARPPAQPAFSTPPTDAEFYRARVFEEPLVPSPGGRSASEDSALAALILDQARASASSDVEPFASFLRAHPGSRWKASLLLDLGIVYRRTGYFTRALDAWEQSWGLLKGETDPRLKALADRAVGELAELNARLGRYERLGPLFAEIETRDVRGPASEKVSAAREGYSVMQTEPERAFLCGPFGLDRILASVRQGYVRDPKIAEAKSTRQGTSIRQMLELADSVGLKMQLARRSPGARVVVPALVHWKAGHFAALVKDTGDRLLIQDPTFGDDLWITRAVLDAEASGVFLIPNGALPSGWESLRPEDGQDIWGKGIVNGADPQIQGSCPMVKSEPECECDNPQRMAHYVVNLLLVNLHIMDSPVGYRPPVGPAIEFAVAYNQREVFQPQLPAYSNLGPKWTFDWFSFVQDDPANAAQNVDVYLRQGGQETYTGMGSGTSAIHYRSRATVVRTSSTAYERRLPDGSVEVFGQPDAATVFPRRVYLTAIRDPQGNTASLAYSYESTTGGLRIVSATDAIGQVTTFSYESADPLKITKVTDPFGRFAQFEYDTSGRLKKITDVIGITSEFAYGASDFVTTLTTPYGTTTFVAGQNGTERWLETTDPMGAKERFEYRNFVAQIAASEAVVPTGMTIYNAYLSARNSFYWDKRAMATPPAKDYAKARVYHWLHSASNSNLAAGVLESTKNPLESRVWYNYPGQGGLGNTEGTAATPTVVGRVLDDGTSQIYRYEYNSKGKVIKAIDPVGRETVYVWGSNNTPDADPVAGTGIDLLQIKQKNGANYDVLASYTYNSQHLPLTATDASGPTTTYTYNAQGQPLTVETPARAGITENRTTTYSHDTNGYLQSVTGPVAGTTAGLTYDGYGRLRTTTDSDNYTLTYDYDALDRTTKVTYPDGTYEQTVYNRLDAEQERDRLGRWTHTFHDALRRPAALRDAGGRTTTNQWCNCGSLEKVVDPNGNGISWERDVQGRVTREIRSDSSDILITYENTTSRVKEFRDPKQQVTAIQYFADGNWKQVSFSNTTQPTPTVNFTYDAVYNRLATMTDGAGTTTYTHNPIAVPPTLGAGRLASIDGPLANDTISYSYDELNRVTSRGVNGVALSQGYDVLGRLNSETNALGVFAYGYDGVTDRVTSVSYPAGQTTTFNYFSNAQDRRLQEIHNKLAGGTTLSRFQYGYMADGTITTWTQQTDNNPAKAYDLGLDAVNQLVTATLKTTDPTPVILKRYRYSFDKAENRTGEQIDDVGMAASHNSLNALTGLQAGGALRFAGTVSEPSTVTVQGTPATVSADNRFEGLAEVTGGTSTVAVQATDPSGNVRTNTYQVSQSGASKTLTYDANGSLTGDGTRTFEWDGVNRLTAINQGTHRSEFTYDGWGHRVRIVEKDNSLVTSDRRFLWCGTTICEERDATGGVVTKRFFSQGIQEGGTPFFYAKDHLGSIRELTDAAGAIRARYDYDPYGRATKVSGDKESIFGFTGHLAHAASGSTLAPLRVYDAGLGRWISQDPIGLAGGSNLYSYVGGNPVNFMDPMGLQTTGGTQPTGTPGGGIPPWLAPAVEAARQTVAPIVTEVGAAAGVAVGTVVAGAAVVLVALFQTGDGHPPRDPATAPAAPPTAPVGDPQPTTPVQPPVPPPQPPPVTAGSKTNYITEIVKQRFRELRDQCAELDRMLAAAKAAGNSKLVLDIIQAQKYLGCRNIQKRQQSC
jgi:RHS repeat-associated protein